MTLWSAIRTRLTGVIGSVLQASEETSSRRRPGRNGRDSGDGRGSVQIAGECAGDQVDQVVVAAFRSSASLHFSGTSGGSRTPGRNAASDAAGRDASCEGDEIVRALDTLMVLEAAARYSVQRVRRKGLKTASPMGSLIFDTALSAGRLRGILVELEADGLILGVHRRYRDFRLTDRGWAALGDLGLDVANLPDPVSDPEINVGEYWSAS